jgi:hypothetical protein
VRPYDLDAHARFGRIYALRYQVEGLVQANWVEVRVLFGAPSNYETVQLDLLIAELEHRLIGPLILITTDQSAV